MNFDQLLKQPGEWLRATGQDGDVVVSTRMRLARNLSSFKFATVASRQERQEVQQFVHTRLRKVLSRNRFVYIPLEEADAVDRQLLLERHLISSEMASVGHERGVMISLDETTSIMVNEEDHLRIQVLRAGFNLKQAFEELVDLDRRLEQVFPYAFHTRFGYVTCCPTNMGTALRVSVMMHLPAAVFCRQMEKVLQSLARLSFTVRGFWGEGTQPVGDLFQISNQVTLGRSEEQIVQEMQNVVPQLIQFERTWRQRLMEDQREKLQDKIWRAWGILTHARAITSEETLELLSALRLAVHLNQVPGLTLQRLNEIFLFTQPAHLQKRTGRVLEPAERDVARATFIRERLSTNGHR